MSLIEEKRPVAFNLAVSKGAFGFVRPVTAAKVVVAFFLLLKLWMTLVAPPIGDEAYYWMWGQKPAGRISIIRHSMPGCSAW